MATGAAGPWLGSAVVEAKCRVKPGEESGFSWLPVRLSIKSIFPTVEFTYSENIPYSGCLTFLQYCFQMGKHPLRAQPSQMLRPQCRSPPRLCSVPDHLGVGVPGPRSWAGASEETRVTQPSPWAAETSSLTCPIVRACRATACPGPTEPRPGPTHARLQEAFCPAHATGVHQAGACWRSAPDWDGGSPPPSGSPSTGASPQVPCPAPERQPAGPWS